jgi:hypothetical protein
MFIIKSIKRELKTRPIYDCRCDERLEPKDDESPFLGYTGLIEELEYLKIETNPCEYEGQWYRYFFWSTKHDLHEDVVQIRI